MGIDEIKTGLKNAMERGQSLEEAKQSLVNAGYNGNDIDAAANSLNMGSVSGIINQKPSSGEKPRTEMPMKSRRKSRAGLIVVIILALLVFIGTLSYLIFTYLI